MSALSKEEYLKRYLNPVRSGDYKKRKKKNKDKVKKVRGMKIVDDDVSWNSIKPKDEDELPDELLSQEEKPQVEVIDNRTKEQKELDAYRKSDKWKILKDREDADDKNNDSDDNFDHIPRRKPVRHDSDSDMDVPRPSRKRHDSDSDLDGSQQRSNSSKSSNNRKNQRHDSSSSDSDLDVRRRSRNDSHTKGQRSRHDSDSDLEVPRSKPSKKPDLKQKSSERRKEKSRKRHDSSSDSDLDLPRAKSSSRTKEGHKNVKRKNSSDSDMDVPRARKQRHDSSSDSDLNVPRPKSHSRPNESRKSTNRKNSPDSDIDVPRQRKSRHDSDSDLDLLRHKDKSEPGSKDRKKHKQQMSSGGMGGLTSRHDLKKELQERMKMESDIDKLAKESSKSATVFRQKGGKKRDLEKEKQVKEAEDQEKQKRVDKYEKWGKGVTQSEMKDYALEDLIHETNKPLARYRDDADLDALQRSQIRDGDPMAEFLAKKRNKETRNAPSLPKYRGPPAPPNRFGMQPGYRWDGVDRSNGFEKKFYLKQSDRKAQSQEAYKWSVEDM